MSDGVAERERERLPYTYNKYLLQLLLSVCQFFHGLVVSSTTLLHRLIQNIPKILPTFRDMSG